MGVWLILSYDASDYKGATPKDDITEFFLKLGIRKLESYTDSTIHFFAPHGDEIQQILNVLDNGIKQIFPDFKFSLSVMQVDEEGNPLLRNDNPKQPLKDNYDADVIRLKTKLKIAL